MQLDYSNYSEILGTDHNTKHYFAGWYCGDYDIYYIMAGKRNDCT